ncbi:MAG TPA: CotH kinase family protein, partial [Saprospiraceae bacterium]|nr:CotH kinase family protein [Saprospiraceae bacterium]
MKLFFTLCLVSFLNLIYAQSFYDINTVQKIEIHFDQTNWDYILDTATAGGENFTMAKWVKINGVQFDSVGVKYKGNSSYKVNQVKNPFHIELDSYKDQDYQGYTDIKLSNCFKDPSMVREVLSYKILKKYMHAPESNYAEVYVNDVLIGLYSSSESVTKKFVKEHFYSKDKALFKCNPTYGAGPTAKSNLLYLGKDSSLYFQGYELKSDYGWKDLIDLCDTLNNKTTFIENILDVDKALWMISFDNVFVNIDSYIGAITQNYYLYRDDTRRFNSIVWDLNESFGTFTNTGTSMLNSTTDKQQLNPLLHMNDANWPLVQKLLNIPIYKRMYIAHMRTMLNENFANNDYVTEAQNIQTVIDANVKADINKFYAYDQFKSNVTTDIGTGMQSIAGIQNLMNGRYTYLTNNAEFKLIPPTISNIIPSNNLPDLNSSVTINATVTNAVTVFF